ncbi:MAG: DMT family transporter [Chitinophagales bacterium]|nr:DMT family transporter [Chitinophagales bacterium]
MLKARFALIIGIVLISFYPTLVKLNEASTLVAAFYRMFIPALILLPYLLYTRVWQYTSTKTILFALLCGVFFASDIAIWNIAIKESSAAEATLLVNLAPIWVGLASYFFLKLPATRNFWIGAVVAVFGMCIMVGFKKLINFELDRAFFYALLAGFFYASYILFSKKALSEMQVMPFFAISVLSAAIYLGLWNVFMGTSFVGFNAQTWLILFAQGLLVQLLAWLLINYAIKHMRATRVSLSLLSQALLSALFAKLFVNEELSNAMIIGGAFIVSGIAITFLPISPKLKD